MKRICLLIALLALPISATSALADSGSTLGFGATYWTSVDDVDVHNIDDDGFSFTASYQYWPSLVGMELDMEILPDKYGETAYAPQAYVLVGRTIYAAAGVGVEYRDDSFADDPFFALRAGVNLEILPNLYCDIYGTYRFNDSADLDNEHTDIDSDTIYLGAMLRIGF